MARELNDQMETGDEQASVPDSGSEEIMGPEGGQSMPTYYGLSQGLGSDPMTLLPDGVAASDAPGQGGGRRCNCKKAKCLKLYCVCFAGGLYCNGCPCRECQNTGVFSDVVLTERQKILERSPNAFAPKVEAKGGGDVTHKKGCRCRKSRCLKKYCECFDACVPCSFNCRCDDCHNQPEGGLALQLSLPHAFGTLTTGSSEAIHSSRKSNSDTNALVTANAAAAATVPLDGGSLHPNGSKAHSEGLPLPGRPSSVPLPACLQQEQLRPNEAWTFTGGMVDLGDGGGEGGGQQPPTQQGRPTSTPPVMLWQDSDVQAKQPQVMHLFKPNPQHVSGNAQMTRRISGNGSIASRSAADSATAFWGATCSETPTSEEGAQHRLHAMVGVQQQQQQQQNGKLTTDFRAPLVQRPLDNPPSSSADWMAAIVANSDNPFAQQRPTSTLHSLPDFTSIQHLDPQMFLQPAILIAEPQYAARLAACLGLDEAHQMASQKAAQILKTLIQLGNENPVFQQQLTDRLLKPSASHLMQSDQISEQLMSMPLSAVLDTGTKPQHSQRLGLLPFGPSGCSGGMMAAPGRRTSADGREESGYPRRSSNSGGAMRLGSGTYRLEGYPPIQPRGSADSVTLSDGCRGEERSYDAKRRSDSGGGAISVGSMGAPLTASGPAGLVSFDSAFESDHYAEACLQSAHILLPSLGTGRPSRATSLPPPTLSCLDSARNPHRSDSALHLHRSQQLQCYNPHQQAQHVTGLKRQRQGSKANIDSGKQEAWVRSAPMNIDLLDSQNEMDALQALFDLSSGP